MCGVKKWCCYCKCHKNKIYIRCTQLLTMCFRHESKLFENIPALKWSIWNEERFLIFGWVPLGRSRSGFMIQDHSDPDASKGTDESLSRWCLAVYLNTWVILNAFHKCHNNLITMQWESRDLVMIRHQLILCILKTRLSISCRSHFPHTVLVALHISRLHYLNQACQ